MVEHRSVAAATRVRFPSGTPEQNTLAKASVFCYTLVYEIYHYYSIVITRIN
jgi:hypothetical protein